MTAREPARCVAPVGPTDDGDATAFGEVVDQPIRGGEYRTQSAWRDADGQWWIAHPTDARGPAVKVARTDVSHVHERGALCGADATTERTVEGLAMPLCGGHAAELDAEAVREAVRGWQVGRIEILYDRLHTLADEQPSARDAMAALGQALHRERREEILGGGRLLTAALLGVSADEYRAQRATVDRCRDLLDAALAREPVDAAYLRTAWAEYQAALRAVAS